jgi:DNA polymerase (family 10)
LNVMRMRNREIADVFNRIAALLSIQSANPFRIRAYRNAATAISRWPEEFSQYLDRKVSFPKIPGIGKDLESKILELLNTGHLEFFEDLKKKGSGNPG